MTDKNDPEKKRGDARTLALSKLLKAGRALEENRIVDAFQHSQEAAAALLTVALTDAHVASSPKLRLVWKETARAHNVPQLTAEVGNYDAGDGVRFYKLQQLTCYRRGPWKLIIEVAGGAHHHDWGCFDSADQPMRYYHDEGSLLCEADAIAAVLVADRIKAGKPDDYTGGWTW